MIKLNQGVSNEILRLCLFLVELALEGFFLYSAYLLLVCGKGAGTVVLGVPVLGCALFWAWLSWSLMNRAGAVTLSESGVSYRALFFTHHCRWGDIRRAGVLRLKNTKLGVYYELVLRKPVGILEPEIPSALGLNNDWKWIHLSNDRKTRELVEQYYGTLDFDLTE